MRKEDVLQRLKNGEHLRNFGSGWSIGKPHRQETVRVTIETVGALEADGSIIIRMNTRSLEAVLVR